MSRVEQVRVEAVSVGHVEQEKVDRILGIGFGLVWLLLAVWVVAGGWQHGEVTVSALFLGCLAGLYTWFRFLTTLGTDEQGRTGRVEKDSRLVGNRRRQ